MNSKEAELHAWQQEKLEKYVKLINEDIESIPFDSRALLYEIKDFLDDFKLINKLELCGAEMKIWQNQMEEKSRLLDNFINKLEKL